MNATAASRAPKSPEAFRTISEVSEDLDLPQHVLRFWETRFAQVKPMKRGGGRRLYRPDHVALLRGIKALLYDDGLTIKGVQKMLREKGSKTIIARGKSDAELSLERVEQDAPREAMLPLDLPEDAEAKLDDLRARVRKVQPKIADSDRAKIDRSIGRLEDLLSRLEGER